MSQRELSARLGLSPNVVGNYERGRSEPSIDALKTFADIGIDVSYLVTGTRTGQRAAAKLPSPSEPEAAHSGMRLSIEGMRLGVLDLQMSEAAGVSLRTFSNWILGKAEPDAAQLRAMAALGVDVQYVVTGQRGAAHTPGYREVSIPEALLPMVDAWLGVHQVQTLDQPTVQLWAEMAKRMGPAYVPASPQVAKTPARVAADAAIDHIVNDNMLKAIDQAQAAEVKHAPAPAKSRAKSGS